ncbi:MAG: hypothetical protein ABIH34_02610 [Nanoarchaeota archaeon]
MALFGKKDVPEPAQEPPPLAPTPQGPPTGAVLALREQGMSNNQIIRQLQQQGYPPNMVYDAMNQADMQSGAPIQGYSQGYPPQDDMPPQDMMQPSMSSGSTEERIEEIAEAIIDEKWNELVKSVNKIIEWKERTDQRIAQMEQRFVEIEKNFNSLHHGVLGKIGEYDQNIVNLGADIKAMEQVFQKILPELTENVSELGRITTSLKKPKKP